jgi:voltage-gated potassium channel Kch
MSAERAGTAPETIPAGAASGGVYRLKDWYFLAPFAVAGYVLGVWGFLSCTSSACARTSFGDAIFRTLLLVIHVGANFTFGTDPLQLVIAQVVLPLILVLGTISAGIRLVLLNLRHDVQIALVRAMRGHVIVCGLGTTGAEAVRSLSMKAGKVVAISLDPASEGVECCEQLGVPVMTGDATSPKLLNAAGIARADAVIMATGSDARNMEICLSIETLARPAAQELKLFAEIRGTWLLEMLAAQRTPILRNNLQLHPFRADEIVARAVLRHPAFSNATTTPRLFFVGFGDLANMILRQAALSVYAIPGLRVRAICYDEAAETQDRATRSVPWRQLADLEFIQQKFTSMVTDDWAAIGQKLKEQPPDIVIVTLPDDDAAFQAAIAMRNELDAILRFETPIFVRVRNQLRLGGLLRKMVALPFCPHRLTGFGDLGSVVSPDALFDEQLDTMARAVHEAYLANSSGDLPARLPWPVLPEHYRRSSRAAADHIPVKLNLARYRAVSGKEQPAALDDVAIECMAAAEHYRWCLELKASGWTQGAVRSDLRKIHPLLVPWEALPETARHDNREQIRAIPATLARVGMQLKRIVQFAPRDPPPTDPAVLPLLALDPTVEQDWADAEIFAGARDCIAIIRRVPGLRIEALAALQEKYPSVARILAGWHGQ